MNEDIEQEEWGQETDEWMLDDDKGEFISFRDSPGDILVLFTGKPRIGRSNFAKKPFWFPCTQIVDVEKGILEEKTLSTSSRQLRKKITKLHNENEHLFEGLEPVGISWVGNGMERKYSVSVLAYESKRIVLEKIGKGNLPTPP